MQNEGLRGWEHFSHDADVGTRGWGSTLAEAFEQAALALVATASPFARLSIIPLLTLIAFYAPTGHRAPWFALMASVMNLELVAGQLQKYLNQIFVIGRGDYMELGPLLITVGTTSPEHCVLHSYCCLDDVSDVGLSANARSAHLSRNDWAG